MNQLPGYPSHLIILGLILLAAAVLAIGSHFWPSRGSGYPSVNDDADSAEGWK